MSGRQVLRPRAAVAIRGLRAVSRETALLPVHAWRLVSRLLPPRCRYHPSCSAYAVDAVRRHGIVAGTALAAWRLLRCNPWSLGGIDPVPSTSPLSHLERCWKRPARHRANH